MAIVYVVKNRDVDGSSSWKYKRLAKALEKFEAMSGWPVEPAVDEMYFNEPAGSRKFPDNVMYVRAIGSFGNVVSIEAKEVADPAPLVSNYGPSDVKGGPIS